MQYPLNASKINAKENCENVNELSRKLHFCENCYIWGKAIAGNSQNRRIYRDGVRLEQSW